MKNSRPTILIAGGAGFLGSHFCDAYVATHTVVCLDDLSTGRKKNIEHLLSNEHFSFVLADITEPLPAGVSERHYDVVANLASPASPPRYQQLALETLAAGSLGTWNLLKLAHRDQARLLHASTSEVYGDPEVHPQSETYRGSVNSYGPRSMYDEAKRFGEALIYSFRRAYEAQTTIARIFNTYGPRMDPLDGRVVSNFIVQALKQEPLTVYGDGKQTRSFCYVSDLVEGMVQLIASSEEGPVNLGNPNEFTVMELAEKVLALTGSRSSIDYRPLPQDDPFQRRPDIGLAKEKLGWEPKVELEEGLRKTIEYFRKELG